MNTERRLALLTQGFERRFPSLFALQASRLLLPVRRVLLFLAIESGHLAAHMIRWQGIVGNREREGNFPSFSSATIWLVEARI